MSINNKTIGETISRLRLERVMTQQQLSSVIGVSHQAVSKWENGAALPDLEALLKLSRLFGVSVEELTAGAETDEQTDAFPSFIDQNVVEGLKEAAQTAAKYKLDNLTLIVDNNGMQSGGSVEDVGGVVNIPGKFAAFGFEVKEADGHDVKQIMDALTSPHPGRPLCVVAHTVKGRGVSYMEHNNAWHKGTPNDEQYLTAVRELEAMING